MIVIDFDYALVGRKFKQYCSGLHGVYALMGFLMHKPFEFDVAQNV